MAVQGHDFLGKASVNLAALLNENPDAKATDSMWLPLLNKKGAKGKGELRIGLEFLSAAQAQQVRSHPVSRLPSSGRGSGPLQVSGHLLHNISPGACAGCSGAWPVLYWQPYVAARVQGVLSVAALQAAPEGRCSKPYQAHVAVLPAC